MAGKGASAESEMSLVKAAIQLPPAEAARALADHLQSRHGAVVEAAAKALGKLGRPEAGAALIDAYRRGEQDAPRIDRYGHVRTAIVAALGTLGSRGASDVVRRALHTELAGGDGGVELRSAAALALARVDPANAIHDLALVLFESDPSIPGAPSAWSFAKAPTRIAAAHALAALGDPAAAALLGVKLRYGGSEVAEVLSACIQAITLLQPPNLAQLLRPYLTGHDPFLAATAGTSLARELGAEALDLLRECAGDMPLEARLPVVLAITAIRSERTPEVLGEFVNDRDPQVRRAAEDGIALYRP